MKEKEEAEENKCNNSGGTEERNGGTERSTVDTMSVLIYSPVRHKIVSTIFRGNDSGQCTIL